MYFSMLSLLKQDEANLCSLTSQFEDIVVQLMDRLANQMHFAWFTCVYMYSCYYHIASNLMDSLKNYFSFQSAKLELK